jgi:hypothetical protein
LGQLGNVFGRNAGEFEQLKHLNKLETNFNDFSQSKTLASDSGVIFSPPSIMREALDDSELYLNDEEDAIYINKNRHREPATKVKKFIQLNIQFQF